jgi:hypothetical protein
LSYGAARLWYLVRELSMCVGAGVAQSLYLVD